MAIATINPANGETLKIFTALTAEEIETKLAKASAAFGSYRKTKMIDRAGWLRNAADLLEKNAEAYGKMMTLEMGKPIQSAIAEAKKCALVCRYYADNAADFLKDLPGESDGSSAFVRYQPLGIVLAVMPWNFPFWQVFRFAAPALMAGNVGLLKHASNVPQCALAIEEIILKAGFPEGAFQTLLIGASQVESVVADDRVQAATLTGSEPAGASLASTAGKYIKKTVLELGGSDPFIVLDSADINAAVATGTKARMLNNGQSCIAAKRFIVSEGIADEFEKKLVAQFQTLKVGDPLSEDTDIGPLATASMCEEIADQVQKSVEMGAKVLIGGKPLEGKGNFYPPTILTEIPAGSPADTEEFFGPVALFFRVKNIDEAIALANATPLGLGASVWTNNHEERDRAIEEIEAGAVFINGLVKSDPRLPFGGIKRSGYGRELSIQGIHEFVNIKTVWIK
ncbi:MAG: NAD-dependent succinate-semialdehyde dehydrogenase [Cyanobacteria bacterium SBLK]|nr:NAD-dependent succinate-semialdehyde dehydrogenase [Cyanobacteria bacterium SBLK]